MRLLAFFLSLTLFNATALAASTATPEATIAAIYKAYQDAGDQGPKLGDVYSHRMQALLDEDAKSTPQGEVGKIDWDVFVDGQDWKITDLTITTVSETDGRATVKATFNNLGEARDMQFDLVLEQGRWLVDDIRSLKRGGRWTMSKVLEGAPDAFPDE